MAVLAHQGPHIIEVLANQGLLTMAVLVHQGRHTV